MAKFQSKNAATDFPLPEFGMDSGREFRQAQSYPVYAAMISSIDEITGHILKILKDLSLEKNTIVIFISDNGGESAAGGKPTSNMNANMPIPNPDYVPGVKPSLPVKAYD